MLRPLTFGVWGVLSLVLAPVLVQAQDNGVPKPTEKKPLKWTAARDLSDSSDSADSDEPERRTAARKKRGSRDSEPAAEIAQNLTAPNRLENPVVLSPTQETRLLPPSGAPPAVYLDPTGTSRIAPDVGCYPPAPAAQAACPPWPPRLGGFWVRPEFLYWRTEGAEVPPLVTSGGTGILGQPGTSTVFGNDELLTDWRTGYRLHAGFWLNPNQTTGIEGNAFLLPEEEQTFTTTGTAAAPFGRPFFNIQTPAEDVRLLPAAGFTDASIGIRTTHEMLGAELMLRQMVNYPTRFPTAILVGYRYLNMEESLRIDEGQTGAGGVSVTRFDSFETENTFHGVNVGFITELRHNRWTTELLMKVALGSTNSKAIIQGGTTTTIPPAAPVTAVGGMLAQSTNIGTFEQDEFAVVPELGATIGFNLTERLKATVGYTFLYWSRVARAGEQIDRDLNLPPVPGPTTLRPEFAFNMTDYWAQGVNLGLEYNF